MRTVADDSAFPLPKWVAKVADGYIGIRFNRNYLHLCCPGKPGHKEVWMTGLILSNLIKNRCRKTCTYNSGQLRMFETKPSRNLPCQVSLSDGQFHSQLQSALQCSGVASLQRSTLLLIFKIILKFLSILFK